MASIHIFLATLTRTSELHPGARASSRRSQARDQHQRDHVRRHVTLAEFRGRDEDRTACERFAVEARATHLGNTPPAKGVGSQEAYEAFMAKLHEEQARTFPASRLLPAKARNGEQHTLADLIRAGGRP